MSKTQREYGGFSARRMRLAVLLMALTPAAICAFFHLRAPLVLADEGLTWFHGASAVLANCFGPWAGPLVRLVEFPNAGLRSFNLPLALALTLVLAAILCLAFSSRRKGVQLALLAVFVPFACSWFFIGFFQIADGLL